MASFMIQILEKSTAMIVLSILKHSFCKLIHHFFIQDEVRTDFSASTASIYVLFSLISVMERLPQRHLLQFP